MNYWFSNHTDFTDELSRQKEILNNISCRTLHGFFTLKKYYAEKEKHSYNDNEDNDNN